MHGSIMNHVKLKFVKNHVMLLVNGLRVAELINYADSGCWHLTDIRLTRPHVKPHEFSFVNAEQYWSVYYPETQDEADFVRNKLKHVKEVDGEIHYCTFEGIVEGSPTVNGYAPPQRGPYDGGFFHFDKGMDYLRTLRRFWKTETDMCVKIPNPNLQPSVDMLRYAYRQHVESR